MNRKIILATLTALTAVALVAAAQPARDGSFIVRRIEHRLGITSTQREQVKAILQTEKPTIQSLRQQAEAERTEMDASGSFNEDQVRAIASKYAQTNTDILVERVRVRSEVLAVLTPEQREKLASIRADFSSSLDARLDTLGDQL
jgi:protein CpxP